MRVFRVAVNEFLRYMGWYIIRTIGVYRGTGSRRKYESYTNGRPCRVKPNEIDLTHSRLAAQAAAARLVRVVRLQGRGAYVLARHGALIIRIRGASAVLSSSLSAVPSATRLGRCHGHADEAVAPLVGMQVDLAVQRPEQRGIVEDRRAEGPLYHARSVPHNGREQLTWRWCVLVEDGAQRSLPGNQW